MGENILMKKTLTDNELFDYLVGEANEKFEGWDFISDINWQNARVSLKMEL